MTVVRTIRYLVPLLASAAAAGAPVIRDADTRAWLATTAALSGDAMEGRDTGSAGYARAAALVAARFKAAGLKPGGYGGSYFQSVPLHEVRVEIGGTHFAVATPGGEVPLRFLYDISVRASEGLPATLDAPLSFRGYCSRAEMGSDMHGKIAVCFGGRRGGVPGSSERVAAALAAGAVGLIAVDDPGFTIEPARWPEAYARTVTFRAKLPPEPTTLAVMRLNTAAFAAVLAGSGHDAATLLADGAKSRPLPAFDLPSQLHASFHTSTRDYASDNVLGILAGTDPKLRNETVVLSAHLDGYGFGEPVGGDALYNGAFDDAAYVATIIRLAEQRHGLGFRRSILFAAFTGEEKGLLGATWFTRHPTQPRDGLVADINLDQLRPLFPLKILTVHALTQTTLGTMATTVAAQMGIQTRADLEPERNLNQRADHWPFLQIGVPSTGFVFGYDTGTEAERRYREWYQIRYHRPQDDMTQPIDVVAARAFNMFLYRFAARVADADERPAMIAPKP